MELRLPRPPRAVLFDLDGVLADSFEAWVAVLDGCRARRGLPRLGPGPVRASWGQGIAADVQTFFPGETVERLARDYDAGFLEHLDLVRAIDGAVPAVEAIAAAGLPVAVVTNSPVALTRRVLGQLGLEGRVTTIAGGDEVPRGKPDPALVLLALRRLGLPADQAVFVGDTALDVAAGRAARIPVVGFRIPGADARIDRMTELPPLLGLVG
ncbi:MAG: HAD family hydrolase [Acidobacteria bacterium]|jgi:HAD superfamily hydrolase (TIGR01509 family)|nr:HAD family hydrolase [Acidobacteriota bacterium]MCU0254886.1 HAD family hydrolase [Acidobacteriota bacterium]